VPLYNLRDVVAPMGGVGYSLRRFAMDESMTISAEDKGRLEAAEELMRQCRLCPRCCMVRRLDGQTGFCGIEGRLMVSSYGPHYGEEDVLVGRGGSGTIFLTGCNLGCVFCQNFTISHQRRGREVSVPQMAELMLEMERTGCENVNFVTPTHVAPLLLEAIIVARREGLKAPIVYNCGGYESIRMLELLAGHVEIYMPDVKFFDADFARRMTGRDDYPRVVRQALKIMHEQVGDLACDERGLAVRGLLVRHLVMPNHVDDSIAILDFLANEISPNTYVNVMGQYRPEFKAHQFDDISRPLSPDELLKVRRHALTLGLRLAG